MSIIFSYQMVKVGLVEEHIWVEKMENY